MTIHSCNLQDLDKLGITLINRHPIMESEHILELSRELNDASNVFGNMGIVPYEDGYLCSCRQFCYDLNYHCPNKHTLTRKRITNSLFFTLDKYFNFNYKLNNNTDYPKNLVYEDGRLFYWDNKLYMISTVWDPGKKIYDNKIEVFSIDINNTNISVTSIYNSNQYNTTWREKNWMAIPDKPFMFIKNASLNGNELMDIKSNKLIGSFDRPNSYSGSTPLIKTNNGYYTLVHRRDEHNIYINFLMKFDNDFNTIKVSKPFKCSNVNVEFSCAMLEIEDDKLLIATTIYDRIPIIQVFNKSELFKAIEF